MVGFVALYWFGDPVLGVIVGVALIANLAVAAVAGAAIPLLLRKLSIDPALAGGVILTTVTDVVGFVATVGLPHCGALHDLRPILAQQRSTLGSRRFHPY